MKIVTTTNLYRLFKENDEQTIIRPRNIRTLIKDNNITYHTANSTFLIDYDNFMQKVNPKNIQHKYNIPIIRSIQSATREYNKTHKKKISYHIIEKIIAENKIAFVKSKRYYLLNYKELEKELEKNLVTKRVKEI